MLIKTNWWHKSILMKSGMCQQKCSLRQERVFGSDRWYWSQQMNTALGVAGMAGFPYQLSPMKTKKALPIPAVDFTKVAPSLKKIFNQTMNIYMTPDAFFVTKFREIFQQTNLRHSTAAKSKKWLGGPDMNYWPQ